MTVNSRQVRVVAQNAIALVPDVTMWNRESSRLTVERSAGWKQNTSAADVGGLFFPRTAELGLRVEATVSVRVERKLVYAGVCAASFGKASDHLRELADLDISDERIRRATLRVGTERSQQRQLLVEEFLRKPLPAQLYGKPANVTAPPLACVMADGGRYQVLDRRHPNASGEHWRESRVATFLALDVKVHAIDPTPELPEFLRDVSIAKTLAEIGRIPGKNTADADVQPKVRREKEPPWPRPKILSKTMQASSVSWENFGSIMASHAWYQGFNAAVSKVFVSDGSAAIEKVHQRYFSHYTSVLDLMHALSYCLAAARAVTAENNEAWHQYVRWATFIWQGNVDVVIQELDELQERIGEPEKGASQEDRREVIRRARVYYRNHKGRMNYPEYRKKGYPLTSSVMESSVKQIGQRVKGSEKFWSEIGGEAILTMRGDYLSDSKPIDTYWRVAQATATGQREYKQAA